MTEIDDVSARLIVLETVVRQLITHMAVRDEDPSLWVQTRKTLAMSVIDVDGPIAAAFAARCDGGVLRPGGADRGRLWRAATALERPAAAVALGVRTARM